MMISWIADSQGEATLVKATPKEDPSGGDVAIWTLDFALGIDQDNAGSAEGQFPALKRYLTRAEDGQFSANLKVSPRDKKVRLSVEAAGDWQEDLFDASTEEHSDTILPERGAEVSYIRNRLTEEVQTQVARVVVPGVPNALATRIVRALGRRVCVSIAVDQQELFAATSSGPREGQVVIGHDSDGNQVCGLFVEDVGESSVGVDDFGERAVVTEVGVALTLESNDDTPVHAYVEKYREAAEEAGVAPTYAALVQGNAIAAEAGNAPPQTASTFWVSDATIKAAVEHQSSELPPEA